MRLAALSSQEITQSFLESYEKELQRGFGVKLNDFNDDSTESMENVEGKIEGRILPKVMHFSSNFSYKIASKTNPVKLRTKKITEQFLPINIPFALKNHYERSIFDFIPTVKFPKWPNASINTNVPVTLT